MKRSIRRWFYGSEFISSVTSSIFNNPFWCEEEDGTIVPFPNKDQEFNKKVQTYYSKTLPALGFFSYVDGDDFIPVQLVDGIAVKVNEEYIRDYIKYVLSKLDSGHSIVDVMTQRYERFFSKRILTSLRPEFSMSPLKDTRDSAYRFYNNGVVKITGSQDSIELIPYGDLPKDVFVWADQIIDRCYDTDLLSPPTKDEFEEDLTSKAGHHFHKWCQNLCKDQDEDGKWVYNKNKFKTLASGFGYLLHQKWNEYKCVIFVDSDLEEGKANGRTGKSLVLDDALSHALESVTVEADSLKKDRSSKFLFHGVNQSTQYICLDDACKDFEFSTLFSKITGPFTCEKKYGGIFQFSKSDKPKIGLSSNHPIVGEGSSFVDRQHIVEVGGFYRFHKMELKKDPALFHDGWLFDEDWSDENWMEFDAFLAYSLLYYLKEGLLGGRTSNNYGYRKLVASVGSTPLVNVLQRFLDESECGVTYYQKYVKEMGEDLKDLCLDEYVNMHLSEEEHSLKHLHTSLHSVADHFGYGVNRGKKVRPQKRFGPNKVGVNSYSINPPNKPFGSGVDDSSKEDQIDEDTLKLFEDLDPVKKFEKTLLPKPVIPTEG